MRLKSFEHGLALQAARNFVPGITIRENRVAVAPGVFVRDPEGGAELDEADWQNHKLGPLPTEAALDQMLADYNAAPPPPTKSVEQRLAELEAAIAAMRG